MDAEKRRKTLMITAISAVGLLLADKMLFTPLANVWKDRADQIAQLRADVEKGEFLMDQEVRIESIWRDMIQGSLPNNKALAEDAVISSIDQWALLSRMTITSFTPQWRENEEDHTRLEIRLEGQGSFESVLRFLYEMDRETLPLRLESLQVGSREKNGSTLGVDIRVSGLNLPLEEPSDSSNPES